MPIRFLFRGLAALAVLLPVAAALAQPAWPTRPVRIVVPYAPGGITDTVTRLSAPKIQEAIGQPVLVENKVGNGGALATEYVAKSPADGYTLLMGSAAPQTLNQFIQKLGYDGLKDFAPVTLINTNPLVLLVNPALPAQNVKELIALAKAQPGKLNFAGAGGLTQFSGEIFKFMAGVDMVYVPYKGGAPATAATVAGDAQVTFANYSDALPQMRGGKLRALGITSGKRFPQSPEVPTIGEAGVKDYVAETWAGLVGPANTPPAVVARLQAAIAKIAANPAIQARLAVGGSEAVGGTSASFASTIKTERVRWAEIVKLSGARATD